MCDFCEEEMAKNRTKRIKELLNEISENMTDANYHDMASLFAEIGCLKNIGSIDLEDLLKLIKENWWKWSN